MEQEKWKDIDGFEGLYKISSYGRVYSVLRDTANGKRGGKLLHSADNGHGYKWIGLWVGNNCKKFYIHRLVAQAFIPNPKGLPEINHKDENTANNHVENLEWCDRKYNVNYGTARKRIMETYGKNGHYCPIDKYDKKGNIIKAYSCSLDLGKDGISRRGALNCCIGRTREYKGFVYRFHGEPFSYREDSTNHFKVAIRKYAPDGKEVASYPSIVAAEEANGLNRNYLYSTSYAWTRDAVVNGFTYKRA